MTRRILLVASAVLAVGVSLVAQAPAPGTARGISPIDLTGNWVSVVTEDWRFRMVTPPKGDYASVPLNAAARAVADKWDPVKDEADAGTQTRVLHFTGAPSGDPSWQGYSQATWEIAGGGGRGGPGGGGGGRGGAAAGPPPPPRGGSLKVVTTRLKEGYLRKNGVPYSENAMVTEYFDRHSETDGSEWFTVTTVVDDTKYLGQNFITSTHFKKEPDASKFSPSPCRAK